MATITVVVSGSFRKHLTEIQETIRQFEALGVTVRSPRLSPAVNPGDDFVLLGSDDIDDPSVLERRHLGAIVGADLLYICNPGGYIGLTVAMEIGWAKAHGAGVIAAYAPDDVMLVHFVDAELSPQEVVMELMPSYLDNTIDDGSLA